MATTINIDTDISRADDDCVTLYYPANGSEMPTRALRYAVAVDPTAGTICCKHDQGGYRRPPAFQLFAAAGADEASPCATCRSYLSPVFVNGTTNIIISPSLAEYNYATGGKVRKIPTYGRATHANTHVLIVVRESRGKMVGYSSMEMCAYATGEEIAHIDWQYDRKGDLTALGDTYFASADHDINLKLYNFAGSNVFTINLSSYRLMSITWDPLGRFWASLWNYQVPLCDKNIALVRIAPGSVEYIGHAPNGTLFAIHSPKYSGIVVRNGGDLTIIGNLQRGASNMRRQLAWLLASE